MRTSRAWLVLLLLVLCGCGARSTDMGKEVRSSRKRIASPQVAPAQLTRLVAGNTDFALRLYQRLRSQRGNVFYSPYSLSLALGMTYAGARGQTEKQMAQALSFYLPQAELHPTFNALAQDLSRRGNSGTGEGDGMSRLHIVNALWGQTGGQFLPSFLDTLSANYDAGMRLVDLRKPDAASAAINRWIGKQTEDKITDLVSAEQIEPGTVLVLTDAVSFRASWKVPFSEQRTDAGRFTLLDGQSVRVDMMHGVVNARYAQADGCQVFELPYASKGLTMAVLLPASGGLRSFEDGLTSARLAALLGGLEETQLQLSMPRFSFESSFDLRKTLIDMGMRDAFRGADFSGMDGGEGQLFLSAVVHKALVQVDEKGTEAAAATAVMVCGGAAAGSPREVIVDRPFLLLIRDTETGTILFLGRVEDPRG